MYVDEWASERVRTGEWASKKRMIISKGYLKREWKIIAFKDFSLQVCVHVGKYGMYRF